MANRRITAQSLGMTMLGKLGWIGCVLVARRHQRSEGPSSGGEGRSRVRAARGAGQRLSRRDHPRRPEGRDAFEIESSGDKIVLRGNNGVAIGAALNW